MSTSEYKQLVKEIISKIQSNIKAVSQKILSLSMVYNLDLQEGRVDESTHFLGRAMACIVLLHLGCEGPSLGLQREIVAAQVRMLLEVAGSSG